MWGVWGGGGRKGTQQQQNKKCNAAVKGRQEEKGQREGVKVRRGEIFILFFFFPQEREMERKAGRRGV